MKTPYTRLTPPPVLKPDELKAYNLAKKNRMNGPRALSHMLVTGIGCACLYTYHVNAIALSSREVEMGKDRLITEFIKMLSVFAFCCIVIQSFKIYWEHRILRKDN